MNWLDWLVVAFLAVSAFNGFREGFVRIGIGFAAMIVGFLAASWFGGIVADSLMPYVARPFAAIAGFMIVFFGVIVLGSLLAMLLTRMLKLVGLSPIDRVMGGAFGLVRGFVVIVVVAMVVTAFAPKSLPGAVQQSQIAPYVFGASRELSAMTPFEIRDRFGRAYHDLKGLWEEAVQRKPKSKRIEIRNE